MDRVSLTGIAGYIGQHCAAELLRQGYNLMGTICSRVKADATRIAIAKVAPVDSLSLLEADLLSDRGWAAAYDHEAIFDVLQWQPTPLEPSFR